MPKIAKSISEEVIQSKICLIRGKKVMLDRDLARLYGVQTKVLNQAVTRNLRRFPPDFMYQLTKREVAILKSQIVTSRWGGVRKPPFAFTENGVAMLSSVLNSKRAIEMNIQIMRIFTRLREILASHEDLRRKIETVEKNFSAGFKKHEQQIQTIFMAIKKILEPPPRPKRRIGFIVEEDRRRTNQSRRLLSRHG